MQQVNCILFWKIILHFPGNLLRFVGTSATQSAGGSGCSRPMNISTISQHKTLSWGRRTCSMKSVRQNICSWRTLLCMWRWKSCGWAGRPPVSNESPMSRYCICCMTRWHDCQPWLTGPMIFSSANCCKTASDCEFDLYFVVFVSAASTGLRFSFTSITEPNCSFAHSLALGLQSDHAGQWRSAELMAADRQPCHTGGATTRATSHQSPARHSRYRLTRSLKCRVQRRIVGISQHLLPGIKSSESVGVIMTTANRQSAINHKATDDFGFLAA